jgi:(1->4)-alpha-D-glucan 1-alpha-D-glucosylmutase
LIASGRLHGLRLDHIDGLSDPIQYARRLSRLIRAAKSPQERARRFYIVAEKILADGEPMPRLPGVAGTTGYDVLNVISRVLLDPSGMPRLDRLYRQIDGEEDFAEIVHEAKLRVLETMLASEFTVLCRLLARIAAGHWPSRDFTFDRLRAALQAYVVNFPVYRTYISGGQVSPEDRATITRTIEKARAGWYGPDPNIFDFLRDVLTLDLVEPGRTGYSVPRVRRFTGKVQQLTGPVMAKALEDTAFYRYHRLLALNEVGGEPSLPPISVVEFHRRMTARLSFPHAMTATATHDTKRGEDARMRSLALAEMADDWTASVETWRSLNEQLVERKDGRAPWDAHYYMVYLALIGAWPDGGPDRSFVERMQAYAVKALREGKQESSWHNPNEAYEAAVTGFLARVLDPGRGVFLESFAAFARRASVIATLNSLSQLVLKATIPGVPDFYQGTEFWDLSLVDPDNRQPVDFAARRRRLAALASPDDWAALAQTWEDGTIKLALTHRLLALRAELRELFTNGGYEPIEVTGRHRDHVLAFARVLRRDAVIVAVGRHFAPLTYAGRYWPRPDQWDAELALEGFDVAANGLAPDATPARGRVAVNTLFGAVPAALLRATRRR